MTAEMPDQVTLPAGLRELVLAASARSRPAGQTVPEVIAASPAKAFCRAAADLCSLLETLSEQDWRRPVIRGLDSRGLAGHLIGVEQDVQRSLAGDGEVAHANHVASTDPVARLQAGRDTAS